MQLDYNKHESPTLRIVTAACCTLTLKSDSGGALCVHARYAYAPRVLGAGSFAFAVLGPWPQPAHRNDRAAAAGPAAGKCQDWLFSDALKKRRQSHCARIPARPPRTRASAAGQRIPIPPRREGQNPTPRQYQLWCGYRTEFYLSIRRIAPEQVIQKQGPYPNSC